MTKKQEAEILMRFLRQEGVLIDDRISKGIKDGIREVRRAKFREERKRERRQYAKKRHG